MRIGIIACEILKNEIEALSGDDPGVVHREYLEMGLHDNPEQLRETLIKKVNELVEKVDIVFVGYAVCKSLENLPSEIELPVIKLREEDCIGSMLGPIEYAKEREACPGTWFSSPGWAVLGLDAIVNDEQVRGLEGMGYDKLYFAKRELEGYSRCLFIDTGGVGWYQEKARDFAALLGLRFECRTADIQPIRAAWNKVKTYALTP